MSKESYSIFIAIRKNLSTLDTLSYHILENCCEKQTNCILLTNLHTELGSVIKQLSPVIMLSPTLPVFCVILYRRDNIEDTASHMEP